MLTECAKTGVDARDQQQQVMRGSGDLGERKEGKALFVSYAKRTKWKK